MMTTHVKRPTSAQLMHLSVLQLDSIRRELGLSSNQFTNRAHTSEFRKVARKYGLTSIKLQQAINVQTFNRFMRRAKSVS